MHTITTKRGAGALREVKRVYKTAFPKEERLPFLVLRLMTLLGARITAYYENDVFCGFTHTTIKKNIVFVMFFAVQDELRQKGYGSAILSYLKARHPGKTVVLNVEPLDDSAPNAKERVCRMRFYAKNGFHDTGYLVDEVGGTFCVLSTSPTLDTKTYLDVFKKLSFGLWRPRITKA